MQVVTVLNDCSADSCVCRILNLDTNCILEAHHELLSLVARLIVSIGNLIVVYHCLEWLSSFHYVLLS